MLLVIRDSSFIWSAKQVFVFAVAVVVIVAAIGEGEFVFKVKH
jgi:hypothetical protein